MTSSFRDNSEGMLGGEGNNGNTCRGKTGVIQTLYSSPLRLIIYAIHHNQAEYGLSLVTDTTMIKQLSTYSRKEEVLVGSALAGQDVVQENHLGSRRP